jgi:predicted nucleic acid-binding protein
MVVLDASVIYKWLVDEKPTKLTIAARKIRLLYLEGSEEVIAPNILIYELANTFAFKTRLDVGDIQRIWKQFAGFNIPMFSPDYAFIQKAIEFAKKHGTSVYDASYAVAAKEKKCDLITADAKFVDQVNLPFVKKLSTYS